MPRWPISDERLREMYRGGAGNDEARWWARFWGRIHTVGVMPRRWVTLEVPGRRTGRPMRVPLGMADHGGQWYLVSMLGECNWVRNVRANDGRALLHHGRALPCRLVEVPPDEAAPILQRYLDKVPGGRPHLAVATGAPLAEFAAVADRYPVFEVRAERPDGSSAAWAAPRSWFPAALAGAVTVAVLLRRVARCRR